MGAIAVLPAPTHGDQPTLVHLAQTRLEGGMTDAYKLWDGHHVPFMLWSCAVWDSEPCPYDSWE